MSGLGSLAQAPSDTIDLSKINFQLIENLLFQDINDVRKKNKLNTLTQDSILGKAALDQVKYMRSVGKIGHSQIQPKKATVRLRVQFYGGSFLLLGENAAMTTIMKPMKVSQSSELQTVVTYQDAANFLLVSWLKSESHRKNIMNSNFERTGLKLDFDQQTQMLYAVQVFGRK